MKNAENLDAKELLEVALKLQSKKTAASFWTQRFYIRAEF